MSAPLRFFFVGGLREWKPLDGHQHPSWQPFQYRSLPGNVVASAPTEKDADLKLQSMLERCFARAGSAQKWYNDALASMSEDDKKDFQTVCFQWFGSGQNFQEVDGIDVVKVSQELLETAGSR